MRLKINKRETLLKHPPLTSIFEQQATVDLVSEKRPSGQESAASQNPTSYQVSVIVPQINNIGKSKTEAHDVPVHNQLPQPQVFPGLRRLSENTESFSINLPIVLAANSGGHGSVEVAHESCLKPSVEPRTKCKSASRGSLEKSETVEVRRSSRSSLQ